MAQQRATSVCLALLVAASFCLADTVHLKNGKSLEGEVIREDDEGVTLRLPYGEIKLRKSEVEAVERQTPTEYRISLGKRMLAAERFEQAVRAFEEALIGDRRSVEAKRMLANTYWLQAKKYRELNRFVEARSALEKLQKLDPKAEHVRHTAGELLQDLNAKEQVVDGYIAAARELANKNDISRALQAYEKILTLTPDARATVGPEMADCHIKRAASYMQSGQLLNAAGDFEAALRLNPKLADQIERLYCSCVLPNILNNLAGGDLGSAQTDLKRALEVAPNNKNVLYVAGRLEEALGKIPAACDAYARALGTRVANPTPAYLSELRKRLETEINAKGDRLNIDTSMAEMQGYAASSSGEAKQLETENFTIYHYNEALAREAGTRMEADRLRILNETGLRPWQGKTRVFLHRTQAEYTARTGLPEWTGGVTRATKPSGSEHLQQKDIHSWQTSPRLLSSTLPHEITHVIVNENALDLNVFPRCINEGIAVAMEPKYHKDYYMNFLRIRLKSQDFIPLTELIAAKDYPRDPDFFYAESYALIEYLISLKGIKETTAVVKNCTSLARTYSELLRLTGAGNLEELETKWRDWIIAGGK
ncbi:MAG TPA: tetratricopeptide repeat protein [Planctomycetota bacterium]|nr:tetratricopeptide repeat protein [Planctomycetota bacterium]